MVAVMMKRTKKSLHLDTQTIRALGGDSLVRAAGASDEDPTDTARKQHTCHGSVCLWITQQCV
jgi:hypothetical protein